MEKEREEQHHAQGPSIGLPHLDYSVATSLHTNGNEDDDNKDNPSVHTIWIPLNDTTNNNICIYVVPK